MSLIAPAAPVAYPPSTAPAHGTVTDRTEPGRVRSACTCTWTADRWLPADAPVPVLALALAGQWNRHAATLTRAEVEAALAVPTVDTMAAAILA